LDFVQQQVLGVAARAVPLFLASLAVPGGAFVQVARGLYNGVVLFVEKGKQIAQVGQALFAAASAIAAGQLAPNTPSFGYITSLTLSYSPIILLAYLLASTSCPCNCAHGTRWYQTLRTHNTADAKHFE
jgi:hypothetical protein